MQCAEKYWPHVKLDLRRFLCAPWPQKEPNEQKTAEARTEEQENTVRRTADCPSMRVDPLELPPQHAGVELSELTLVAACALPEGAALWPVRAVEYFPGKAQLPVLGPCVVCGPSVAVEELLRAGLCAPIYVVSESTATTLAGHENITAAGVADGQWEGVVGTICSRHIATIPQMILEHACSAPDAPAVADASGEISYAELVSAAWRLGAALTEELGLPEGGTVGVLLSENDRLLPVTLLALGLRRIVACHLSSFAAQRQLQLERLLQLPRGCSAVLVDRQLPDGADAAAGSGARVFRLDLAMLMVTSDPI